MPRLGASLLSQPLTHAEAKDVRDKCIHASRERIQERINIIQRRLKLQEEDLEKRQAQYKRSRDHVDGADEEYEQVRFFFVYLYNIYFLCLDRVYVLYSYVESFIHHHHLLSLL